MEIPVLIEAIPGHGFRARSGEPLVVVAEGATPDDALDRFQESVSAKLRDGAMVKMVEIQPKQHPLLEFAGIYDPNNPIIQEWLRVVEEQRNSEVE